jgi:hypothetical protein
MCLLDDGWRQGVHLHNLSVYPVVQVAYHASRALLQYIRAQLVIHLTALQRRLRDGPVSSLQLCPMQHLLHNHLHFCSNRSCSRSVARQQQVQGYQHSTQSSELLVGHMLHCAVTCDSLYNSRPSCCLCMLHVSTGPLCSSPAAQAHQHHCSNSR